MTNGLTVKIYSLLGFIVQLRSLDDHLPLPGVTVGDIGMKFGSGAYNSMDNGVLRFDHVRIPRDHMLMRYVLLIECTDGMLVLMYKFFSCTYNWELAWIDKMVLIILVNVPESHKLHEKEKLFSPMFQDNYFMELWFLFAKQLWLMLPLHCRGQYVLLLGTVLFVDSLVQMTVVLRHRYGLSYPLHYLEMPVSLFVLTSEHDVSGVFGSIF